MNPEPSTILSVSIENFRVFRDRQTIELDASANVVSGSNGKGKTSFFDAIQWLLLGSLSRLASLASRRSGEYIVNRFADVGALASVSVTFRLDERVVTVTRTGDHRQTQLRWEAGEETLVGTEAEGALAVGLLKNPEISLRDAVLTSGVLQQDVVRAVLEDEPKNRYRHMASFLGLEEIAGFEDQAKQGAEEQGRAAKQARDDHATTEQQLRTAEAELARLEQRLAELPEISQALVSMRVELAQRAPGFDIRDLPTQSADAVALGQLARRIRATAEQLASDDARLRDEETTAPEVDADELAGLRKKLTALDQEVANAERVVEQANARYTSAQQRASDLAELAARAIPLLGERCPVCAQTINAGEVEAHLRELIDAGGEDLTGLADASLTAEQLVTRLQQDREQVRSRLESQEAAVSRIDTVKADRERWRHSCAGLGSSDAPLRPETREAVTRGEADALNLLMRSADHVAATADRLASLLATSGLGDEVERQRSRVDALRTAATELAERAAQQSRQAESAKTLAGAATRAVAGVARERFAVLQPVVDDIFGRLAPHPAFTTLGFEMGVSYRSGVADPFVKDPESGVTGDPLLVFSSSQANVAALTYFLALSWTADQQGLPFLLLDDPLQSMDDVNALGFADLCRHIRARRQLVVSTHERRLASLLERKLAPRSEGVRTRIIHSRDGIEAAQRSSRRMRSLNLSDTY